MRTTSRSGLNGATRFADPNDYLLKRRPQILALNNTWVLSNDSVLALRYGWTRFVDNNTMTIDFDPADLGFSPTFLDQVDQTGGPKFPNGSIAGYSGFGAITPSFRTYKSWNANASYSKLVGRHTFKFGADYRKVGVYLLNPGDSSGRFQFDKEFTSATGLNNSSTTDGNAFASFLLGYPSANAARQSTMTLTTPLDIYTNYFGGYLQDDWRVSSKPHAQLRAARRARRRHARSGQQLHGRVRSGCGERPLEHHDSGRSDRRDAGAAGERRSDVRWRRRQQDDAGQSAGSANGRPASASSTRSTPTTALRAGYGLYWAPWNYPAPSSASSNYGQLGFTQNTVSPQTAGTPTVSLTNPFPNGLVSPLGNSLGALTGVGTTISYVDQNRTAPRVQQVLGGAPAELPGAHGA